MAATSTDTTDLLSINDYKLKNLSIITSEGSLVDITGLMLELNIFEDIFSPTMTGDVVIGDALDLISNLQFHGNEFIQIEIDKPSLDQPIRKTFRIYKISDRSFTTATLMNYTIHFCSEEMILSTQVSISKSYKGLRIDQIIKDILQTKLRINSTKLGGIFSETYGNFDLIVPRMQPFEAILWLATKAYNNNQNLFFFFENRDGFNFVSYEKLLSLPTYNSYFLNVKATQEPNENHNSMNYLKVVEDFNIIKSMRYGSFSSSLMTLDLINRKFKTNIFSVKSLSNNAILNKQTAANDLKNRLGTSLYTSSDSMVKFIASTDSDPNFNTMSVKDWLPQTAAKLGQLHSCKLIASIPGDILLKAGAVVKVNIPVMTPRDPSTPNNDTMRSGRYLVSSVHHKFTLDISVTIVELLSDTVNINLATAVQNSPTIQKVIVS